MKVPFGCGDADMLPDGDAPEREPERHAPMVLRSIEIEASGLFELDDRLWPGETLPFFDSSLITRLELVWMERR